MADNAINIDKLRDLITRCKSLLEDTGLSEDDTRAKLIDPLLKEVLGWDEEYIVRQPSLETKDSIKRPDYWYPKIPKVIVEAKKLSVDLELSNFDEQVLEYAYNRSVNLAILTNFKLFKAWYISKNGEIYPFCNINILSDSIENIETQLKWFQNDNLLSNKIEEEVKRRGIQTGEIDISNELTISINLVREKLNNYLKKEYQTEYSDEQREELTQGIINRLIFIKKIEAEGLEDKQLDPLIRRNSNNIYRKLKEIFEYYRVEYDSDIFGKPKEMSEVEKLELSDDITNEILEAISHPLNKKLNYNFAAIDQDILGDMYENYLAYVQKRAKLIGGKSHKKEQGIYYTPKYIVDFILQSTLGEVLKTAKLNTVKKLRILDPACGSGSFLIAAVKLLDEYYTKNYNGYSNFSPTQKLNILKQNIYGVDLDEKAIRIAELNIYLTVLTLSKTKSLIKGELLPVLRDNLKVGDSLIDDSKIIDYKSFKWNEQFPEIINNGGFDVIIGNPPYINIKILTRINRNEKEFYKTRYKTAEGNYDIYVLFLERAINLLKNKGFLGFIVPNKFTVTDYGIKIRKFILDNCSITKIVDISNLPVFKGVGVYPLIFTAKKETEKNKRLNNYIKIIKVKEDVMLNILNEFKLKQELYEKSDDNIFSLDTSSESNTLLDKLKYGTKPLGKISTVNSGTTGFEYKRWGNFIKENYKGKMENLPFIITGNISRYSINRKKYVRYLGKRFSNAVFVKGEVVTTGKWNLFSSKKLVIGGMGLRIMAAYDEIGCACGVSVYTVKDIDKNLDLFYLLGVINSKLIDYYYKHRFMSKHLASKYVAFNKGQLEQIPIKLIDPKEQKPIISLVKEIITLNKRLIMLMDKKTDEKARIEEEIQKTDKEIDELVYKIYGITDEENKIIEESLK